MGPGVDVGVGGVERADEAGGQPVGLLVRREGLEGAAEEHPARNRATADASRKPG